MMPLSLRQIRLRLGLAAVLGLALPFASAATALPVRAASYVSFGTPGAQSTFLTEIRFDQPVMLDARPTRVELLITEQGAAGVEVEEVDAPSGTGSRTLTYSLDTPAGALVPNEQVSAQWRITFADGTIQTGPSTSVTYADTGHTWRTRTGGVIRLHWYQGSDAFARRAIEVGSAAIEKAASTFGVTESNPVDFFIYSSESDFVEAIGPGAQGNVGGLAYPQVRTMFALVSGSDLTSSWTSTVVAHELTHLVFDTATTNPFHEPPAWLNEGLAVYLSQGYDSTDQGIVRRAVSDGSLVPLAGLVRFPLSTLDSFAQAYAESASAIDFLVRTHGQSAVKTIVQQYATGATDDDAFRAAIGTDVAGFNAAWLASIGAKVPASYGPQVAPAGPLPPGWTGSGASIVPSTPAPAGPGSGSTDDAGTGFLIAVAVVFIGAGGALLAFVALGRRRGRGSLPPGMPPSIGGGA